MKTLYEKIEIKNDHENLPTTKGEYFIHRKGYSGLYLREIDLVDTNDIVRILLHFDYYLLPLEKESKDLRSELIKIVHYMADKDFPYVICHGEDNPFVSASNDLTCEQIVDEYLNIKTPCGNCNKFHDYSEGECHKKIGQAT
jgi:hypothetical protein